MMSRSTLLAHHVALVLVIGSGGTAEALEPPALPKGAPDGVLDLTTRAGAELAGGPHLRVSTRGQGFGNERLASHRRNP